MGLYITGINIGTQIGTNSFSLEGGTTTRQTVLFNSPALSNNQLGFIFSSPSTLIFNGQSQITFPGVTGTVSLTGHTHSISDISSGILPISQGGLGLSGTVVGGLIYSTTLSTYAILNPSTGTAILTSYNNGSYIAPQWIYLLPTALGGNGHTLGSEPPLGNSGANGAVLQSTTAGVRSWSTALFSDSTNGKIGVNLSSPTGTLEIVQKTGNTTGVTLVTKKVASQTGDIYQGIDSSGNVLVKINSSGQIKPAGYITSANVLGQTSNSSGLTFVDGIYVSGSVSVSGITSTNRNLHISLISGLTPSTTGVLSPIYILPYSNTDGTTQVYWKVRRIDLRSESIGSGSPTNIEIEYYQGTGAFSASGSVNTSTLSLAATSYEASTTSVISPLLVSGTKLRAKVTGLNVGHGPLFIGILFEQGTSLTGDIPVAPPA